MNKKPLYGDGEPARKRSVTLVEALLKFEKSPSKQIEDMKVIVQWLSDKENCLEVTGQSKDGKSEGTTLKDLLNLVESYSNDSRISSDKESIDSARRKWVQNGIEILEEYPLSEDRDQKLCKVKIPKPSDRKKTGGKNRNDPYWKFVLNLKGKKCTIEENIDYVRKALRLPSSSPSNVSRPKKRGHFSKTCPSVEIDSDGKITATCKTIDGKNSETVYNLNGCIANIDGNLKWSRRGNYADTCKKCRIVFKPNSEDAYLECDCQRDDKSWNTTELNLDERIDNTDGALRYYCGLD